MIHHLSDVRIFVFGLLILIFMGVFQLTLPAFGANPKIIITGSGNKSKQETAANKEKTIPDREDGKPGETIVVNLSDDQVKRLIDAISKRPQQDASIKSDDTAGRSPGGLIEKIRFITQTIQWRVQHLKSGIGDDPEDLPQLYRLLSKDESEKKPNALKTIMSVIALFVAGFAILWLFYRFIAAAYRQIEDTPPTDWKAKIGRLAFRSLLDFAAMCVFTVGTLLIFFMFMERTGPQAVLFATYLAAFLIVMGIRLISRFLLAPKVPNLRFLPLDNAAAAYLYRWIMTIASVGSFGWLTCGIFRVAGAGEGNYLIMVAAVNLVVMGMIITMIIQKRNQVRQSLTKNLPETGLRAWLARIWHRLAIFSVLMLWLFSAFNLLLNGITPKAPGIQTLLIIPLYFLLDWTLREIVAVVFGIAAAPDPLQNAIAIGKSETPDSTTNEEGAENGPSTVEPDRYAVRKGLDMQRYKNIISRGLRIALAAGVFFYLLKIWGIDIQVGRTVARTAFNILVAVLICYVTWEVISAAIQRRIRNVATDDDDDDREEGGSGGSRIGTLLLLLRKFMLAVIIVMAVLIILSSLGVNIGPLIAGAGVIGLAIGFGSQALVKDIISGLFYLMDDAFRVGDYIEAAGTRGTVEQISLRSLKLRHPRGMVNTIPFGDIGIVQNMSRDYIITKLDFRVRYDTDVEKVRKIIKKKVYEVIMENEELAPLLMGKIKSQGVRQMDDSAMIMRVKYKTAPGEQFKIRKEVYRLLQEAFKEEGIEFAHRNVTVYIPPGETAGAQDKKAIEAGAAAAVAAEQSEAEQKPSR